MAVLSADLRGEVRQLAQRPLSNFINGRWTESHSTATLEVRDPATATRLSEFSCSTQDALDAVMNAARAAAGEWAARRQVDHSSVLLRPRQLFVNDYLRELF